MRYIQTTIFCLFSFFLVAQESDYVYEDHIFLQNIESAFFHLGDGRIPIINKGRGGLRFTFDDMDATDKEYIYKIFHCTKDWTLSDIEELEYMDGINENTIDNYEFDNAFYSDYTTYTLIVPNEDISLLYSGNYILEIYDNSGEEEVIAITKRFIIIDSKVRIELDKKPIQAANFRENQEVNISIDIDRYNISNPMNEIYVSVFQNGNWSNAQHNIKPTFIQGSQLKFNVASPIVFRGYMEFRMFDIRGLRFRSEYVESIDRHEKGTDVILKKDFKRYTYYTNDDFNGSFRIVEDNNDFELEYVNVTFRLKSNIEYEEDMYVFGALSQWGLKDKFRMSYNEEQGFYTAEIRLKQGVYNYMYALDSKEGLDLETIEGSSGETENVYSVVVYYRSIGSDYDQAIAYLKFKPFY